MSDELGKIFLMLGEIRADQTTMKKDIVQIKETVDDYRRTKNKLIGACVVISASVGGGLSAILQKLGIDI